MYRKKKLKKNENDEKQWNKDNPFKVNIEDDGTITFDIEKELGVEIVGETKVKIAIEEDEEPWDEIDDEMDEKIEEEIDNKVNEDYIQ